MNGKDKSESKPSDIVNLGGDELSKEEKQMYKRAKNYVNVGELRKSTTAISSNGSAIVDDEVLAQLRSKHPKRPQVVTLPPMDAYKRSCIHSGNAEEEKAEETLEEFSRHVSEILNPVLTSVTVTADQILSAVKTAQRLSFGGLW